MGVPKGLICDKAATTDTNTVNTDTQIQASRTSAKKSVETLLVLIVVTFLLILPSSVVSESPIILKLKSHHKNAGRFGVQVQEVPKYGEILEFKDLVTTATSLHQVQSISRNLSLTSHSNHNLVLQRKQRGHPGHDRSLRNARSPTSIPINYHMDNKCGVNVSILKKNLIKT